MRRHQAVNGFKAQPLPHPLGVFFPVSTVRTAGPRLRKRAPRVHAEQASPSASAPAHTLNGAKEDRPGDDLPPSKLKLLSFYVPAVSGVQPTHTDQVLEVKTLRAHLAPRPSPLADNPNWDGHYVDDDLVALNTLHLGSPRSQPSSGNMSLHKSSVAADEDDGYACDHSHADNLDALPPSAFRHRRGGSSAAAPAATEDAKAAGGSRGGGAKMDPGGPFASRPAAARAGPDGPLAALDAAALGIERKCVHLPPWARRAGPESTVYFDAKRTHAAIVTCGGLCPGLNDVVQCLVHRLTQYGVPEGNTCGIRYGLRGFYSTDFKPLALTDEAVDGVHLLGGTVLGTSRGGADIPAIVKRLGLWETDMLFVVGGDGGNKAAEAITEECERQGVRCCVVGVPKSIDNDIQIIDETFGFETAVQLAQEALAAAKVEASSALRGIGLVKLMGRSSGTLAMTASMASSVVDACLIPEIPFMLDGPNGLVQHLQRVMAEQGHAVVCTAEGAGQSMIHADKGSNPQRDPSGNPVLQDVGSYLKSALKKHFPDADVKYIDPTYMIRAVPSSSTDHILCKVLAFSAVDAAFAGYTGLTVGKVNTHVALLPIPVITQAPRLVDPFSKKWNRLCTSNGQPFAFL